MINYFKLCPFALQKKFVVVFTGTVQFAGATKISGNRQNTYNAPLHASVSCRYIAGMLSIHVDLADDLNGMRKLGFKTYTMDSYITILN